MLLPTFFAAAVLVALSQASTFTVTVGIDETNGQQGLGFDPSSIFPAAGDTITFTFPLPSYLKNPNTTQHSATQSTFDNPCVIKGGGFDTGVQSTGSENAGTGSSYTLLVNDTTPIWFFSSANTDCKSGMVLSVNPATSGDQTAAAFKKNAESSTASSSSSSSSSSSTSGASSSSSASGTASASASASNATASTTSGAMGRVLPAGAVSVTAALVGLLGFTGREYLNEASHGQFSHNLPVYRHIIL